MNSIRLHFQIPESVRSQWLKKLDEIIEQFYSNPDFNVPTMAQKMGLSERSLLYKLKKETNQTPSNYLKTYRLEKAYKLLISPKYPSITEVCYQSGFNNTHYFSRQFREHFNYTLTEVLSSKKA